MTWRITIAALALLGLFGTALAAFGPGLPMIPYTNPSGPMLPGGITGPMVPNVASGSGPPPSCTQGKLDFSGDCNTVYAGH